MLNFLSWLELLRKGLDLAIKGGFGRNVFVDLLNPQTVCVLEVTFGRQRAVRTANHRADT